MVGMLLEFGRNPVLNRALNLLDRPPGSDSGSVSDPEDVGGPQPVQGGGSTC